MKPLRDLSWPHLVPKDRLQASRSSSSLKHRSPFRRRNRNKKSDPCLRHPCEEDEPACPPLRQLSPRPEPESPSRLQKVNKALPLAPRSLEDPRDTVVTAPISPTSDAISGRNALSSEGVSARSGTLSENEIFGVMDQSPMRKTPTIRISPSGGDGPSLRSFSLSSTASGSYPQPPDEKSRRAILRSSGGDGTALEPPGTETRDFAQCPAECRTAPGFQDASGDIPDPLNTPARANDIPEKADQRATVVAAPQGPQTTKGDQEKNLQGIAIPPCVQNAIETLETLDPTKLSPSLNLSSLPSAILEDVSSLAPKTLGLSKVPIPGVPIDQTGLVKAPPTPTRNRKRQKAKAKIQKLLCILREKILGRGVLTMLLGRQLAGPVAGSLKLIRKGLPPLIAEHVGTETVPAPAAPVSTESVPAPAATVSTESVPAPAAPVPTESAPDAGLVAKDISS